MNKGVLWMGDRISLHKFGCLYHRFSLLRLNVEEETLSTSTHNWETWEWVFCHDDLRAFSSKSSSFCTEWMSGGWCQGWNVVDKEQHCLMAITIPTPPEANLAQSHWQLQNHSFCPMEFALSSWMINRKWNFLRLI